MLVLILPLVSCISILAIWAWPAPLPHSSSSPYSTASFGGGHVVLRAKMGLELSDDPTVALVTFGFFTVSQGVGNVITGWISAELIGSQTVVGEVTVGRFIL